MEFLPKRNAVSGRLKTESLIDFESVPENKSRADYAWKSVNGIKCSGDDSDQTYRKDLFYSFVQLKEFQPWNTSEWAMRKSFSEVV